MPVVYPSISLSSRIVDPPQTLVVTREPLMAVRLYQCGSGGLVSDTETAEETRVGCPIYKALVPGGSPRDRENTSPASLSQCANCEASSTGWFKERILKDPTTVRSGP